MGFGILERGGLCRPPNAKRCSGFSPYTGRCSVTPRMIRREQMDMVRLNNLVNYKVIGMTHVFQRGGGASLEWSVRAEERVG